MFFFLFKQCLTETVAEWKWRKHLDACDSNFCNCLREIYVLLFFGQFPFPPPPPFRNCFHLEFFLFVPDCFMSWAAAFVPFANKNDNSFYDYLLRGNRKKFLFLSLFFFVIEINFQCWSSLQLERGRWGGVDRSEQCTSSQTQTHTNTHALIQKKKKYSYFWST